MYPRFDRYNIKTKPLKDRHSKVTLADIIDPDSQPPIISQEQKSQLEKIAESMKKAKDIKAPIILAMGAHLIKNGLGKIIIRLMEQGYIQHILSNGAASIHDWEFAYLGKTSEDVKANVAQGQFGLWEEERYIHLAIIDGAKHNLGYGESVGKMIHEESLPQHNLKIPHPHKDISILAAAYRLKIPFSVSVNIGQDILHIHPACSGEAIGKTSYNDFLSYTHTVAQLEKGVYISCGSAITSPMCFEKALSASRNIAHQQGKTITNFNIFVNDLQPSGWDWSKGEPPMDHPAYYLRFFKTFSRMGPVPEYIQMDNRAFLHNLYHLLK